MINQAHVKSTVFLLWTLRKKETKSFHLPLLCMQDILRTFPSWVVRTSIFWSLHLQELWMLIVRPFLHWPPYRHWQERNGGLVQNTSDLPIWVVINVLFCFRFLVWFIWFLSWISFCMFIGHLNFCLFNCLVTNVIHFSIGVLVLCL